MNDLILKETETISDAETRYNTPMMTMINTRKGSYESKISKMLFKSIGFLKNTEDQEVDYNNTETSEQVKLIKIYYLIPTKELCPNDLEIICVNSLRSTAFKNGYKIESLDLEISQSESVANIIFTALSVINKRLAELNVTFKFNEIAEYSLRAPKKTGMPDFDLPSNRIYNK